MPRHYVLALPWWTVGQEDPGEGNAHIYEPSSGAVRPLDLTASRDPHAPAPRARQLAPRPRRHRARELTGNRFIRDSRDEKR